MYVGESGFDERNFNLALTENPNLLDHRRVIRMKHPVAGEISLPEGNAVVFMLIDGSARVGEVRLSACRRIGSITTAEGPYLMDAQACLIDGPGRVLIGTSAGAAAFALPNANGETLIVLDVAFLARKAPDANITWLLKEIGR
jgi:hypothetical protein